MKKLYLYLFTVVLTLFFSCNKIKTSKPLNDLASVPSALNPDKLGLEVVTIYYDKKSRTISTLYGNRLAFLSASDTIDSHKAGEVYMMVTWQAIDNQQWFGAKIPGKPQEIEIVKVVVSEEGNKYIKYTKYAGETLALLPDIKDQKQRSDYILSRRASILP